MIRSLHLELVHKPYMRFLAVQCFADVPFSRQTYLGSLQRSISAPDRGLIMDKEHSLKGSKSSIAGCLQRQVGEWTGETKLQAEGAAKQVEGKVQKLREGERRGKKPQGNKKKKKWKSGRGQRIVAIASSEWPRICTDWSLTFRVDPWLYFFICLPRRSTAGPRPALSNRRERTHCLQERPGPVRLRTGSVKRCVGQNGGNVQGKQIKK